MGPTGLTFNNTKTGYISHVRYALSLLFQPGDVFEIRALEVPRFQGFSQTFAGFFNDHEKAAKEAIEIDAARPVGVYFTLNPVNPDFLAKAANRMKPITRGKKGPADSFLSTDADILRRQWFLIDFDPVRPGGISSTDVEKAAAFRKLVVVRDFLASQEWALPIEADSGNGCHLLYRVDLANDPESLDLLKRCLEALKQQFSDAEVGVDTTVCNAARICKLYGTATRKGDSLPDRPYRRSKITGHPPAMEIVSIEQLRRLADTFQPPQPKVQTKTGSSASPAPGGSSTAASDILSRARKYLENTPPAVSGQQGDTATFRAAATLVKDFNLSEQEAFPLLQEWNQKCIPPWDDQELLAKLRSAMKSGKHSQGSLADAPPPRSSKKPEPTRDHGEQPEPEEGCKKRPKQNDVDAILEVALDEADVWRGEGQVWATIPANGVMMNLQVRSPQFRAWVKTLFRRELGKAVGDEQAAKVAGNIEAVAFYGGEGKDPSRTEPLFTRIGHKDGNVYVDLADELWRVVEIDQCGWRVISNSPIKFRRSKGMLPLPIPEAGGSINDLRGLINASIEEHWILIVAWLVGAIHPQGPYPVLIVQGEQGTAKSTLSRLVRDLIDPHIVSLRTCPRDPRDIMIAGQNGHVMAFDNLSGIQPWLSDLFCRIATGGGFSARELYTDSEETLIYVKKPLILNGIDDVADRGDLRSRGIVLNLERIPDDQRREERDVLAEFNRLQPRIMGALFDAVSVAIKNNSRISHQGLPRMADFAAWVMAAEDALPWPTGTFLPVFNESNEVAIQTALEGNPIAKAIRELAEERQFWSGRASDLLEELGARAPREVVDGKFWPKDSSHLSRRLKRLAPELLKIGVEIVLKRNMAGSHVKVMRRTQDMTANWTHDGNMTAKNDLVSCPKPSSGDDSNKQHDGMTAFIPSFRKKNNNREEKVDRETQKVGEIAVIAAMPSCEALDAGLEHGGNMTAKKTGENAVMPPVPPPGIALPPEGEEEGTII